MIDLFKFFAGFGFFFLAALFIVYAVRFVLIFIGFIKIESELDDQHIDELCGHDWNPENKPDEK